jgi:hypothetical protein
MRIISFITYNADIRKIPEYIGAETELPHITPGRGPPLWGGVDPQDGERVWSQRRTGTKLAKRHQTLRPISASVG